MHEVEAILCLLVAVAILVTVARKLSVPYPVPLVMGGLVLALIPGLPTVKLRPELTFLLFLPPLLYRESITSPLRECLSLVNRACRSSQWAFDTTQAQHKFGLKGQ